MQSSHAASAVDIAFDDPNLIADGGLVSVVALAEQVGRPELVGTLPEFRNRGLIRAQMDILHQWSAERGQPVQAITGIPFFYRQFGYEMALPLQGGRSGFEPNMPPLSLIA